MAKNSFGKLATFSQVEGEIRRIVQIARHETDCIIKAIESHEYPEEPIRYLPGLKRIMDCLDELTGDRS